MCLMKLPLEWQVSDEAFEMIGFMQFFIYVFFFSL